MATLLGRPLASSFFKDKIQMGKRKGYLIFTTHDGDELDATLITDAEFFNQLKTCEDNDAAIQLWDKWCQREADDERRKADERWYVMTLGRTITEWPFNDLEVLDTYYFIVY
jgi:hypothetical protein